MTPRLAAMTTNAMKPIAGFIALIVIWQFGAPLAGIPRYVLPLPSAIAARFAETFWVQVNGLAMTGMTTVVGLGAGPGDRHPARAARRLRAGRCAR